MEHTMIGPSNLAFPAILLAAFAVAAVWKYFSTRSKIPEPRTPIPEASVPSLDKFDLASTDPYPYRPWRPGKFQMTMGLRKMPEETWLVIDNRYLPEQRLRKELLTDHRDGVIQYLPGSEAACEETLDVMVDFLTQRYPRFFTWHGSKKGYLKNEFTGQVFKVTKPLEAHPLEVGAQLVMEDINILMKGDGTDDNHYLRASYSMAPAGWDIRERIGWPLWKIHSPVPMWNEKLLKSVEKFFFNLKVDVPMERNNFFVQTNDNLFQQVPFADSLPAPPAISDIRLRYERQTFRRLAKTGAVVFLVRTFLLPVEDLVDEPESLRNLVLACRAMPANMAKYKARHVWMEVLEDWAQKQLGDEYPAREEARLEEKPVVT